MWIVYYVEGKTVQFGSTRTYVGSTEVRDGETLKMAADRRVDAHKDVGNSGRGAAFLRCCGDIKLLSFSQFENRLEARADELWTTIEYFRESEREPARASVRGGPYSTPNFQETLSVVCLLKLCKNFMTACPPVLSNCAKPKGGRFRSKRSRPFSNFQAQLFFFMNNARRYTRRWQFLPVRRERNKTPAQFGSINHRK